ncbi:restriction endonuclease subunit S [Tateyamaria omphalii]|uniref:Type I restriction endonuclease n=1 Tax=Tateyamaria omphalii TaxID=299262 RepID=A0A1P8MWB8_9RHOB|nr:restriction endonuclease subunit S [Tateyamaria omphalii]APX12400.1 type I restriction endonuclease [Tateyamaria omphalii]
MSKDAAISQWKEYPFWAVAKPKSVSNASAESLLSIYLDRGVIPYSEGGGLVHKPAESLEKYQLVEPGDLVLNNQQAWRGSLGVSTYRGIVSPAYRIFELNGEVVDTRFSHYLFRSRPYVEKIMLASLSVGDIQRQVKWPLLKVLSIRVPNISIQSIIAGYLDRETARIDGLIEKKTRFIALLKEKRAAVITHAVTRGIDAGVEMKASGVEWIGEVPKHWQVTKLGYLGRSANGINIGGDSFGSGYPFISYGDVYKNRELPQAPEGLVQSSKTDRVAYSVKKGDILFTRTSETVDEVAFPSVAMNTIENAVFAGFLIRFRPFKNTLAPFFSKYAFQNTGLRDFFAKEMKIVTRASLSQRLLHSLPVPLPPIAEQERIGAFLEEQNQQYDSLITKTNRSIALLREKRAALITAAVTGKIDVRSMA